MSKFNIPTKVITGSNTRWSYANVWEPKSINGGTPNFSVSLIIPKSDTKTVEKIKAAIEAAYKDGRSCLQGESKFKGNGRSILAPNARTALSAIKNPLRDGDLERLAVGFRPDDEAYANSYFVNANSATAPGIVDADCNPILERSEVYSGVYGRASINFYAFNSNSNTDVAAVCPKCGTDAIQLRQTGGVKFNYQSGMLFITLPSGRRLSYVKPHIGENKFGGESVTCEDFLDRQLDEAKTALEKAQQALMKSGIDKETVITGGKALEKSIDEKNGKAFAEYMMALVYKSFVMKRRDMKYITSALQAAKPMLLRNIADFDTQEFLLNTPIATYDLRTGTSSEHSADDLITKLTAVSPSEDNMDI